MKQWKIYTVLTLLTYSQEEIAVLEEENVSGCKSWIAQRSAEAAIIDGLYSKSFNSAFNMVIKSQI